MTAVLARDSAADVAELSLPSSSVPPAALPAPLPPPPAPAPVDTPTVAPLPTEAERAAGLASPASPHAAPVPVASTVMPLRVVDSSSALVSFPTDPALSWRRGEGADIAAPSGVDVAAPSVIGSTSTSVESIAPARPEPEMPASAGPEGRLLETLVTPVGAPAIAGVPEPSSTRGTTPPAMPGAPFTPIDIFTYDWRDKDVAPPVPVSQAVSGWWGSIGEPPAGTSLGAVEVVVDERGSVEEARIYQSVNRVYDGVLMGSAKQWRYTPATRAGRPVKYRRITGVVSGR